MTTITVRVPAGLRGMLDKASAELGRTRSDIVRQALERYLEDLDDLTLAEERLRDPTDPVLEWEPVRQKLLGPE